MDPVLVYTKACVTGTGSGRLVNYSETLYKILPLKTGAFRSEQDEVYEALSRAE